MLRLGVALSILAIAAAVNVGDELYSGDSDGRFYVLADKVSTRAPIPASGTLCLAQLAFMDGIEKTSEGRKDK